MLAARLLRRGLAPFLDHTGAGLRFVFSDGESLSNASGEPEATVTFRSSRAEWNAVAFGYIGMLEAYFRQQIDIDGDLCAVFRASYDSRFSKPNPLVAVRNRWHEWRHSNRTIAQARANARAHYGLPREFFRYWLDDPTMTYTCAYWKEGTTTVDEAQRNKLEHVCRKLRLQPGERMADIGCGWGGLMYHAHQRYGVDVTGYNATTEQVRDLRDDIERDGLGAHLAVEEADHREVDEQFDKVAHVGVLEHCGRDQLRPGIEALARATRPGGLGVLHYIGHVGQFNTEFYIRKHVFPGGWIPSLTETLDIMEENGLEILDIENLRRHYALTLDAWAERFDRHWEEIRQLDPERFDEHFRRNWRVYLYGCAEMFRSLNGYTHLFQIVFSKGNVGYDYPMSRAYQYAPDFQAAADDTETRRTAG
ncbi:MAG: cyclopropane-fatty-acyl-phospholipid synthase family protein [Halofilum sp. (in: g-proteobacteria)]|nr:cyclopropane-fatty-acyl-phospholipid synthase family protein [Halofilum sp. (in: g-proteobacteria)]